MRKETSVANSVSQPRYTEFLFVGQGLPCRPRWIGRASPALRLQSKRELISINPERISFIHDPGLQRSTLSDFVLTFARAMVAGDFQTACSMLSIEMMEEYPPSQLRSEFEGIYDYAGETVVETTEVIDSIQDWPTKESMIAGRVCVRIEGPDREHGGSWIEMFDARVSGVDDHWRIDDIVWGRP
jgi:hypothetical protein